MDPPPPLPTTPTSTTAAPVTATSIHLNYPDSVDSSPRARTADGYEKEPLPPVPGAKLRLMCSYGGHIIPRPHDKSLCYVGGETRLVVVDRHSTLSSLSSRLSRSLLNGRPFALKYQLPNEELDSLVSITTDEDLENMIEEYDRLMSSSTTSTRIRLFIFFNKPETAASMGSLLDDAKSETWFVDALNGSGMLPRGDSDTTMDCLLNLDNVNDLEANDGNLNKLHVIKNNVVAHDVQHYSMPDSPPVVETTSSFGSSSSSPSMSNLPPIRVRLDEHSRHIMEEQFAQMTFGSAVKPDDNGGFVGPSSGLPPPVPVGLTGGVSHYGGDHSRILSDDERSDHGGSSSTSVAVNRLRKPPLPLQPAQHKVSTAYNLPSPDSVKSDSSIASGSSLSKPMYCQEQVAAPPRENRAPSPSSPNTKPENFPPIPSPQIPDPAYNMPPQVDHHHQQQPQQQQHYVQASMHYIPHPATTPAPISSYYHAVYAPPQQQLYHPTDQQYPVYVMPVPQTQPYMSMQSNITDTNVVAPSRPVTTPTPAVIPASAVAYKDTPPPVYPPKVATTTTQAKVVPEMAAGVYRMATATTVDANPTQLVQNPVTQYQQQYVAAGYSQMQHPPQAIASANYGYNEYANNIPAHDQVYYNTTQHQAAAAPLPQYQTMTPAAAVAALADASKQLPVESTTQQIRISQPM